MTYDSLVASGWQLKHADAGIVVCYSWSFSWLIVGLLLRVSLVCVVALSQFSSVSNQVVVAVVCIGSDNACMLIIMVV
jgi:hypothetical protein